MKTNPDWQFYTDGEPGPDGWSTRIGKILLYLSILNVLVIASSPMSKLYLNAPGYLMFRIMLSGILLGVLLGIISLILIGVSILWKLPHLREYTSWVFLLGFVPAIITIIIVGVDSIGKPMIHDISTDTSDPPQFQEVKNIRQPGENSTEYSGDTIAQQQRQAYPDIETIITDMSKDDALTEATQVVKDLQWEFINLDYENGIIEAYDTSQIFGFIDDIVIRVRQSSTGSLIDIRSSSRLGKGDLGKNAERIRLFKRTFKS